MTPPNSSTAPRRIPRQKRGERRVAALVSAAAAEFAEAGYDSATMSAIARRAEAPIGSLYQFFPNKESLARALRTQHAQEYEALCAPLEAQARTLTPDRLAARFVALMVEFVQQHPAFLPLLEAPSTTRIPAARERHRQWIAKLLQTHTPRLAKTRALRVATVVMQINRGMMGLYAESSTDDKPWIVDEFTTALTAYLSASLNSNDRA